MIKMRSLDVRSILGIRVERNEKAHRDVEEYDWTHDQGLLLLFG